MHRHFERTSTLVWVLLLLGAAGCEQLPATEILESASPGMPKTEVLALLPDGGIQPSDPMDTAQLMQGYWFERYFIEGGIVEVLWLHDLEAGYPEEDFRSHLNPVIFREDVLDGWGWEHFDLRHEDWLIVERQPGPQGVSFPTDQPPSGFPRPEVLPEPEVTVPADSAPAMPQGDERGVDRTA